MASPSLAGDVYFERQLDEQKLGLKFNRMEVTTIIPGGWAERNGIEVDDEIYEVAGKAFGELSREDRVKVLVESARPVKIRFKRPIYKDHYFAVTLTERKIGMTMKGKFVKSAEKGGWADRNGIQVGDEIAELNGRGYAEMTDEQKLQTFAGPRPIDIKLVRRLPTQPKDPDDHARSTWQPDDRRDQDNVQKKVESGESVSVKERVDTLKKQLSPVRESNGSNADAQLHPVVKESIKEYTSNPHIQEHQILAAAMRESQKKEEEEKRKLDEGMRKPKPRSLFFCCCENTQERATEFRM